MKVVHLCLTPLAGAPIRMVRALNRYTAVQARLINANPFAYGARTFDEDIDFRVNREEAETLVHEADIVHCHHFMELRRNPFGIDLSSRPIIRHFHSEPRFVAYHAGLSVDRVVNDPRPQLVVAQFQERYYPHARPVPNILDSQTLEDGDGTMTAGSPLEAKHGLTLAFAPTTQTSAFDDRWNTKGAPETLRVLSSVAPRLGLQLDVFENLPHRQALLRKACADLVIDELVTGSYHLSGLEALALGKTTFGYLDARTVATITQLTGCVSTPWINVPLYALPECLEIICSSPEVRRAVGESSRKWVQKHWDPRLMIQHLVRAYEDFLEHRPMVASTRINRITDIAIPDYNRRLVMDLLENRLRDV